MALLPLGEGEPKPREVYGETQLQALPFSEAEARVIASLYQTQPLIGAKATKKAVKERLSSYRYRVIHLSTHGILNQKVVGESAIALAPGDGDDGYLTVNDILDLKLNADLVVLSACDTGRGEISGDGVVGLSRALMTAGSRSLIVSLWSVNDRSTSELMQEFYRQWQNGKKSKAVALREAMLKVRQQYPAPYHWAGMTLMGEEK
jgi:CHAT domain-containing protein